MSAQPAAVSLKTPPAVDVERGRILGWAREYPQFAMGLAGGVFLIGAYLTHHFHGAVTARYGLVAMALVLCGWHNSRETIKTLWEMRFDVDVLMFAAALGAAILGQYEEGALLLFLFAMGTAGEEMAMDKARRAIGALAKLAPETAIVRDGDGHERVVKVEALKVGDVVVVRPFDRVAADGKVTSGASAVDQSPITGESIPAEKTVGDAVFAGTINGEGLLVISVTKRAEESTLARVVTMVNEAQAGKSPTQVFTNRVERFYVPIVLVATFALMVLPPLMGGGTWRVWFYRSMAFLTAASPCALAIGTPAAVLSGIARAARAGVLIKGGIHLENLGRVRSIAFDKTGTLTRGRTELMKTISMNGMSEEELLAMAAAVERQSSHPLAKAIALEAERRGCAQWAAEDLEQVAAKGMRARVNGREVAVGRLSLLEAGAAAGRAGETVSELSATGHTTVIVAIDGKVEGVFGLADRPRDNAAATLARLRATGVRRTVMLTGDHTEVAAAIANELGVDEFFGDLLPDGKVERIAQLKTQGGVAMMGDGVNDAPAMATATVGIAMGGAGTDVALETADVALMADDLGKLVEAIGISRMSRRVIVQNLVIALGVIGIVGPMAALGMTTLSIAVMLHEGSTVVVVCNSLRLLFYRGT